MINEEAIENIKLLRFNAAITNAKSFKDALDMAIEALSKPSLPSNLDEAAEDSWAVYEYRESPKGLYYTCYVDGFKAGAEWMTGQGWFSVDEILPKMDEEVIVLSDELGTAPIYKIGFGHIVDVNRCIDYNGWNCPGVKYWMPCPKIPGMND